MRFQLHNSCRILLFCLLLLAGCQRQELPVLGNIPQFQLHTQDETLFSNEDMKGKVWVANFIFTSCGGACPMMTERMKKNIQVPLLEMAKDQTDFSGRILSFSVDPERDNPKVLAEYAKTHGADARYWIFLTGPLEQVTKTVVDGFKISMGKLPAAEVGAGEDQIWEIVHGEQFLLIDAEGRIRGFYSSEGKGLRRLLVDFCSLLKGKTS